VHDDTLHQLLGQHGIRQSPRQLERGQQRGRAAHRVRGIADAVAGPIRRSDDAFQFVDRTRDQIAEIDEVGREEAGVDGGGSFRDGSRRRPPAGQLCDQRSRGVNESLVLGHRERFCKRAQPVGAVDGRSIIEVLGERDGKRAAEYVGYVGRGARSIAAYQERERRGGQPIAARRVLQHRRGRTLDGQPSNYNSLMVVVRYVALAALVIWLGALQGVLVDSRTPATTIAYVCGGVLLVCLFALKFVGPPPRAFVPRLALVVLMLAVTMVQFWWSSARTPTLINMALGFTLLAWYAHE